MLRFKPKCRLGRTESYLFLLSKKLFIGLEYPKIFNLILKKTSLAACSDIVKLLFNVKNIVLGYFHPTRNIFYNTNIQLPR